MMEGSSRTALERLHKSGITATDIATQFWCERQMELNCLHKPAPTKAMQSGARMHDAWQAAVYVPLTVEPRNYPDVLYKIAYENYTTIRTLLQKNVGRELMVYGSVHGYRVSGKIDELQLRGGKVAIVEDKTVGSGAKVDDAHTLPHRVQIMLYRKLLDEIRRRSYSYDNFSNVYKLKSARLSEEFQKGIRELDIKREFTDLESMWKTMFEEIHHLPELSDDLEIRYTDRRSREKTADILVKYDPGELDRDLAYVMGYWRGERESQPVPEGERWKCKPCKFFGNECKVWWTGD